MADKPVCKYGASCYRKNPDHFKQFSHPGREEAEQGTEDGGGLGEGTSLPAGTRSKTHKGKAQPQRRMRPQAKHNEGGPDIASFFEHKKLALSDPGSEGQGGPPPAKKTRTNGEGQKVTTTNLEEVVGDRTMVTEEATSSLAEPSGESFVDSAELDQESCDVRENVKRKFLVEMPEDFYQFWEFCKSLNPSRPESALQSTVGLELVGPYHVLAGRLKGVPWDKCVLHYRYFYDPPEFLTVLKGEAESGFHIGYFRDDPGSTSCILASNIANGSCEIKPEAENIFAAVRWQISSKLENKNLDADQRRHLGNLETKLVSKMKELQLPYTDQKTLAKQRNQKIMARCFHKIGIIVPYDKKTELGYRPLPMNDRELRKLLDKIARCTDQVKRDREFEPLQEIITLVQFANDECDYGMGLELGLDLFCHGDKFHDTVTHLLPLGYSLLQREQFGKINEEHLKHRSHTPLDYCSC